MDTIEKQIKNAKKIIIDRGKLTTINGIKVYPLVPKSIEIINKDNKKIKLTE